MKIHLPSYSQTDKQTETENITFLIQIIKVFYHYSYTTFLSMNPKAAHKRHNRDCYNPKGQSVISSIKGSEFSNRHGVLYIS